MTVPEVLRQSLSEAAEALRGGAVSSTDLVRASLDHIAAIDDRRHAFVTVDAEGALAAAADLDAQLRAGHWRGPLHGIPIAVKDNIPTAGLRTTYNSRAYADWVPGREPPTVTRLRRAGAVIVGKTNLNEFGWSVPSDDDLVAPPRNPWNPEYQAVGSSSGSGVAVASGMVFGALGTDGGGSARLPAGQMGLVGLKPTRGPESGVGAPIDEVSVVSVLTRTAADAGIMYAAMMDRTPPPPDAATAMTGPNAEPVVRLAVPRRQIDELPIEPDVRAAFAESMSILKDLGVVLMDVDVPHLGAARDANFVLISALSHAGHRDDLRERAHLLGASTLRYLHLGAALGAADYLNAREMGTLFAAELDRILVDCAGIATPVSTVVTAEAARRPGEHSRGLNASFTAPFNLTGWPGIAIPSGTSGLGIPIGLQVAARPGQEPFLLRLAETYATRTRPSTPVAAP